MEFLGFTVIHESNIFFICPQEALQFTFGCNEGIAHKSEVVSTTICEITRIFLLHEPIDEFDGQPRLVEIRPKYWIISVIMAHVTPDESCSTRSFHITQNFFHGNVFQRDFHRSRLELYIIGVVHTRDILSFIDANVYERYFRHEIVPGDQSQGANVDAPVAWFKG